MRLCPCESGKPFSECHGEGAPERPNDANRPLHIQDMAVDEGRSYKVVGTDLAQVHAEALKAAKWLVKKP